MQKIQAILQRIAEGETKLKLFNSELSDADVKDIAMALKDNHTLKVLDLSYNTISAAGAKDIAMTLKDNHSLTVLDLSHNLISDAGTKDIAMVLTDNDTLTELNLGHNQVSAAGAEDIAVALIENRTLKVLNLANNQISDAGAKDIARALKDNHCLTLLDLGDNQIIAAGAKDIAIVLKDNNTLLLLDLSYNTISAAGAKDIAMVLKDNHSLTKLDLHYNQISDTGAQDIARALIDNHTLRELHLSANEISDAGAKDIAMVLKNNHTLTMLSLEDNQITDAVAEDIQSFLSRNTTYREKQTAALKYCDIASAQLNSSEINEARLSDLNEALDMADAVTANLENTGYNQAAALSCEVNALRAIAHLKTGNIRAGLDLYINTLPPQPAEAVSLLIADLILDEQPLPDASANRALIVMCLRGTTQYSAIQFNAFQKLRGIEKFTPSQPLATLLGVDKIVSVLDVSKPDEKMQETETFIFYEDLVLTPMNPPVHKVFKGQIPPCVELSHQFELQKKALLDSLKLAYPENPSEDQLAASTPSRY
jgi:Ran GTPase-activating protein (RanGAP) involved in mRNA processing and transport